jgi:hypothetical protein
LILFLPGLNLLGAAIVYLGLGVEVNLDLKKKSLA